MTVPPTPTTSLPFAPKLTGTRLWTSHRSSRTWDQSTVYANVPTSAAFSFTTFATAHDYTPQTTSTAPQAPELWTHFATNNPSSTAPSSTCPGLPAGPPQPVQSSLYAGLPQHAPPQFMASPTPATCTSQHPPPATPPTAKKSPPTKPPPSRRPLTRTSTSGFEDRLRRQFDSQMDQFQSKTQKIRCWTTSRRPFNSLYFPHKLKSGQQLDQHLAMTHSRSAHRRHPSRSRPSQLPPPPPCRAEPPRPPHRKRSPLATSPHSKPRRRQSRHHSKTRSRSPVYALQPLDVNLSAHLFLDIVLHLTIPKPDGLLHLNVAERRRSVKPRSSRPR